jgi:hypothetical protein
MRTDPVPRCVVHQAASLSAIFPEHPCGYDLDVVTELLRITEKRRPVMRRLPVLK